MAGPRKRRRRYIAVKEEASKGVAESVAAADAKILAFNPVIDQDTEFDQRRPDGIAAGQIGSIPAEYRGRARLRVEIRGSGTAGTPPVWARLLEGCALNVTNVPATSDTYAPVSDIDTEKTLTIVVWEDGVKKVLSGAMGNCVIEGEVGRRMFADFDFSGIWNTPTDENPPAITHETTKPPRFANATLTLAAHTPKISRFRFDLGNDIQLRPDHTKVAAIGHAYFADRDPTLGIDPEALKVADHDTFGIWIAETVQALALTLGTSAGNRFKITADRAQYIDPRNGERNGLQTYELAAQLNALDGDDEYSLVFD